MDKPQKIPKVAKVCKIDSIKNLNKLKNERQLTIFIYILGEK